MPNSKATPTSGVDSIRSALEQAGLQSPTRYQIDVGFGGKPTVPLGQQFAQTNSTFYAHSISIPGRELSFHNDEIWGPERLVPIKRTFKSAIVINFIVDKYWTMRQFFETWMDDLINPVTNTRYDYTTIHDSVIEISPLDKQDNKMITFKVKEPYPQTIMPLNMGQDMRDSFTTMQVSFAYREYTVS